MKNIYKKITRLCLMTVFCCVSAGAMAQAWDGTTRTLPTLSDGVYQISNGAEFAGFADLINGGAHYLNEMNAVLTADIDLADKAWTPVGTSKASYSGVFDGAGHTINGLNVSVSTVSTADTVFAGLFGHVAGGTVKNMIVYGRLASQEGWTGVVGLAMFTDKTVTGRGATVDSIISYLDVTVTGTGGRRGGVVGSMVGYYAAATSTTPEIYPRVWAKRCVFNGTITCASTSTGNVGGIVGYATTECRIINSYNTGRVTHNNTAKTSVYVSGILGYINAKTCIVSKCLNWGQIIKTGDLSNTGSVFGIITNLDTDSEKCYFLEGSATSNVGAGSVANGVTNPTVSVSKATLFTGEIAYNLGKTYWGQNIGTDSFPVLKSAASPAVYRVTFDVDNALTYQYTNGLVTRPENDPAKDGSTFGGWYNGEEAFVFSAPISDDVTLTAKWTAVTALNSESAAKVKISALNRNIMVENADGQDVSVYDLTGSLAATGIAGRSIPVARNGVYIVKLGHQAYKVILK